MLWMLQSLISQRFNVGAELAEIINDSSFQQMGSHLDVGDI